MFVVILLLMLGCSDWLPAQPTPAVTVVPFGSAVDDVAVIVQATTTAVPSPSTNANAGAIPTATTVPTAGPAPADTTTTVTRADNGCTPRTDWPTYTVAAGDTLFTIATTAGSDVATLTAANCLLNPNQIEVGQVLYVPSALPQAPPSIAYALIAEDGRAGLTVGCGDTVVLQATGLPVSGDLGADIRVALNELLGYNGNLPGLSSAITGLKTASVSAVSINAGQATIDISQPLTLVGVCADARLQAQLLVTIFQFSEINLVLLRAGGVNVKQQLDMSGQSGPNAVFTRDDIG